MNTAPDDRPGFDERLRALYHQAPLPPEPEPDVWAGLADKLSRVAPLTVPPAAPRRWRTLAAGMSGVLVGALLGWQAGQPVSAPPVPGRGEAVITLHEPSAAGLPAAVPAPRALPGPVAGRLVTARAAAAPLAPLRPAVQHRAAEEALAQSAVQPGKTATVAEQVALIGSVGALPTPELAFPPALAPQELTPLLAATPVLAEDQLAAPPVRGSGELQQLLHLDALLLTLPAADITSETRAHRRAVLQTQRAELARLARITDSLLLAAGEVPPLLTAGAAADSVKVPLAERGRWSVALLLAPERRLPGLGTGTPGDTLAALRRTPETGWGGFNAAVLGEYHFTNRLSLAVGLGWASQRVDVRLIDRHTWLTVRYDTTLTTTTRSFNTQTHAYAVRLVPRPELNPVYNGIGQVIRFDTVWTTHPDTVWTTLTNVYTTNTTNQTVTPTVTKRDEISTRLLKANYRFLTVPVLLRYRLTSPNARWWADVAAGTQWQFFLGGTQLTSANGQPYRATRIGARNGPFRALNVAVMGSVGLNYALTPRLSASVAPTVRWQVSPLHKAPTSPPPKATAAGVQLGMRFAF